MSNDNLSPELIRSALVPQRMGRELLYFPEVTSTMEVARREAVRGAVEGLTVVADRQTAGKGRMQRFWLSPEGSLALTVVLYPRRTELPMLVMVASLAVAAAIERVTGLKAGIKWPNDVLIEGKKVCGILAESDVKKDSVGYALVGIGLNVNVSVSGYKDIPDTATSLSGELGRDVSRQELLITLLEELERLYLDMKQGVPVHTQWERKLVTIGTFVQVRCGDVVYRGVAESVTGEGNLILRQDDGTLVTILAGDVATLRV